MCVYIVSLSIVVVLSLSLSLSLSLLFFVCFRFPHSCLYLLFFFPPSLLSTHTTPTPHHTHHTTSRHDSILYAKLVLHAIFLTGISIAAFFVVMWWRMPKCVHLTVDDELGIYPGEVVIEDCNDMRQVIFISVSTLVLISALYLPLYTYSNLFGWNNLKTKFRTLFWVLTLVPIPVCILYFVYFYVDRSNDIPITISYAVWFILFLFSGIALRRHFSVRRRMVSFVYGFLIPFLFLLLSLYIANAVPKYVLRDDDTKLWIVLGIHPITTSILVSIAMYFGAILHGIPGLRDTYLLYIMVQIPCSLIGRFFVFNIENADSQGLSIILMALLEIMVNTSTLVRRWLLHFVLSGGNQEVAQRKMEEYRVSVFHSHIMYLRMFVEFWSMLAAGLLQLMVQERRGDDADVSRTLVPLLIAIIAEVFADIVSINVDRMYHERSDIGVWKTHKRYFINVAFLSVFFVCYYTRATVLISIGIDE